MKWFKSRKLPKRSSRTTTSRPSARIRKFPPPQLPECPEKILEELDHDIYGVLYKLRWANSSAEEDEWFTWEQIVSLEHACASKLITEYYVGLGIEELSR